VVDPGTAVIGASDRSGGVVDVHTDHADVGASLMIPSRLTAGNVEAHDVHVVAVVHPWRGGGARDNLGSARRGGLKRQICAVAMLSSRLTTGLWNPAVSRTTVPGFITSAAFCSDRNGRSNVRGLVSLPLGETYRQRGGGPLSGEGAAVSGSVRCLAGFVPCAVAGHGRRRDRGVGAITVVTESPATTFAAASDERDAADSPTRLDAGPRSHPIALAS
jgi:hypothetical protein